MELYFQLTNQPPKPSILRSHYFSSLQFWNNYNWKGGKKNSLKGDNLILIYFICRKKILLVELNLWNYCTIISNQIVGRCFILNLSNLRTFDQQELSYCIITIILLIVFKCVPKLWQMVFQTRGDPLFMLIIMRCI